MPHSSKEVRMTHVSYMWGDIHMDHLNVDSLGCIISTTSPDICLYVVHDPVMYDHCDDMLALNINILALWY